MHAKMVHVEKDGLLPILAGAREGQVLRFRQCKFQSLKAALLYFGAVPSSFSMALSRTSQPWRRGATLTMLCRYSAAVQEGPLRGSFTRYAIEGVTGALESA